MVAIIATIVVFILLVFFLAMWARFIFDWVRVFARSWRPRGAGLLLAEASYAVTDPPIKLVRRLIPPLRIGGAALDFAWSIVMLACLILIGFVSGIR